MSLQQVAEDYIHWRHGPKASFAMGPGGVMIDGMLYAPQDICNVLVHYGLLQVSHGQSVNWYGRSMRWHEQKGFV